MFTNENHLKENKGGLGKCRFTKESSMSLMRMMREDEDGSYLSHWGKLEMDLILKYGRAGCPLWISHLSGNERVGISLLLLFFMSISLGWSLTLSKVSLWAVTPQLELDLSSNCLGMGLMLIIEKQHNLHKMGSWNWEWDSPINGFFLSEMRTKISSCASPKKQ